MSGARPDIAERTVKYSLRTIRIARRIKADVTGQVLARQLLKSGTSVGANVHEAQSAQLRADFIAKMYVAYKEARETAYWMRVITDAGMLCGDEADAFRSETSEIVKILSSILLTAKGVRRRIDSATHPS